MLTRIIIANPNAGKYEIDGRELSTLVAGLPVNYIVLDMNQPELPAAIEKIVAEQNVDVLVAMGGDGTIMFVLTLILKHHWPLRLGIIPSGTGNLLAAAMGIPRDPAQALAVLSAGASVRISVGRVNDRYFTLNAGVGIDADVIAETPAAQKQKLGMIAYFIHGCCNAFKPRQRLFTIVADGTTRRVRARGVTAIIQRNFLSRFDPFYKPRPGEVTAADTGRFDICIFKVQTPKDCIQALVELFTQKYADPDFKSPVIEHFEARRVTLESRPAMEVQADGDLIGTTPLTFEYLPHAIEVIVPGESLSRPLMTATEKYNHL